MLSAFLASTGLCNLPVPASEETFEEKADEIRAQDAQTKKDKATEGDNVDPKQEAPDKLTEDEKKAKEKAEEFAKKILEEVKRQGWTEAEQKAFAEVIDNHLNDHATTWEDTAKNLEDTYHQLKENANDYKADPAKRAQLIDAVKKGVGLPSKQFREQTSRNNAISALTEKGGLTKSQAEQFLNKNPEKFQQAVKNYIQARESDPNGNPQKQAQDEFYKAFNLTKPSTTPLTPAPNNGTPPPTSAGPGGGQQQQPQQQPQGNGQQQQPQQQQPQQQQPQQQQNNDALTKAIQDQNKKIQDLLDKIEDEKDDEDDEDDKKTKELKEAIEELEEKIDELEEKNKELENKSGGATKIDENTYLLEDGTIYKKTDAGTLIITTTGKRILLKDDGTIETS